MLRALCKILILITALIGISFIGYKMISVPYYWGNIQFNTKKEYLIKNKVEPTIYFVGSSITFRHVIPSIFDSLVTTPDLSFNLGSDGTLPPQTFYLIDNIIKEDKELRYIFMELNSLDYFGKNFRTTRSKYYLTIKDMFYFGKYIFNSSIELKHKLGVNAYYWISLFEKTLGVGMREDYIKQYYGKNNFGPKLLGKNKDGYYPLPGEQTDNKSLQKEIPAHLKEIKGQYIEAYNALKGEKNDYNKVYKTKLFSLIEDCSQKDIKLIFILNPVDYVFEDIKEMLALFHELPKENRIDLANPIKYPEFYKLENRWDNGHLNHKGAKLFTQYLSEQFNQLRH